MQPLVYKADEDGNISPTEISRVTNYIIAYSCKGTESSVQEKKALECLILKQKDISGTVQDVKRVARKILNEALKLRVISKQESLCQLVGLPLFLCSERIEQVSLAGEVRLSTEKESKTSFLCKYANRKDCHGMSMAQYFDYTKNKLKPESKTVVPHFTGANVEPSFPPTNQHMRGLLLAYNPWHRTFPYKADAALSSNWKKFLASKTCPLHIKLAHASAFFAHIRKEPVAAFNHDDVHSNRESSSDDLKDLIDVATTLQIDASIEDQEQSFDYGFDHDWSFENLEVSKAKKTIACLVCSPLIFVLFSKPRYSDDAINKWLADNVEPKQLNEKKLRLPLKNDGSFYAVDACADDQKQVLCLILSALRSFLQCSQNPALACDDRMLRLTVSGVAGSGKSTLINTLVTVIRRMFGCNSSALVFGPTGTAAFNAGGETTHRGWGLPKKHSAFEVSTDKRKKLCAKFSRTAILIVDERSMIEAANLGAMESYLRQSLQKGLHQEQPWGGIPIVLFVGDDYQLPSINPGSFYCFAEYVPKGLSNSSATSHFCELGLQEFKKMGQKTVFLQSSKRTNENQRQFLQIQKELRCEKKFASLSDPSIERLMSLHVNNFDEATRKAIVNGDDTMHLFATKDPRDNHNALKLWEKHSKENPVSKIRAIHRGNRSGHFDDERCPPTVMICVGCRVSLVGWNINPEMGLYHGSLGIVRSIVYESNESPNTKGCLPRYVAVEFFDYTGPPLWKDNPKCVPVTRKEHKCDFGCCSRTTINLAVAYGKTAHTFQGQSVGPVDPGRPKNAIRRIVVHPGSSRFENNNPGLSYMMATRATTIGNAIDPMSSALYYASLDATPSRLRNPTLKADKKDECTKVKLRRRWVEHLEKHRMELCYSKEQMEEVFHWANTTSVKEEQFIAALAHHHQKSACNANEA